MSLKVECARLLKGKFGHDMDKDEYYLSLLDLHKKYPMPGQAFNEYHYKNYRRIKQNFEFEGVKYSSHIQPLNFKEAAEMYAQYQRSTEHIMSWVDREPGEEG